MKTNFVKATDGTIWCSPILERKAVMEQSSLPVLKLSKGNKNGNPYFVANKYAIALLSSYAALLGSPRGIKTRIGLKSATQITFQALKGDEGFRLTIGHYVKGRRTGEVRDAKVTIAPDMLEHMLENGWKVGDRIILSVDSRNRDVIHGVKSLR